MPQCRLPATVGSARQSMSTARPIEVRTWRRRPAPPRQEKRTGPFLYLPCFEPRLPCFLHKKECLKNKKIWRTAGADRMRTSQRGLVEGSLQPRWRLRRMRSGEILFADDPALIDVGTALLRRAKHEIAPAASGDIALQLLEERASFRLPIDDVVLRGSVDGFGLARRAKELRPTIQVIYMTDFPVVANIRSRGAPWGKTLFKPFERMNSSKRSNRSFLATDD